jgi:hypothetical protein
LCYAYADKLDADPEDRDAFLALGAFYETMALAAQLAGYRCSFAGNVQALDGTLSLGVISVRAAFPDEGIDRLSAHVGSRVTNRHPYAKQVLPKALSGYLEELGCTLLTPRQVAPLVSKASVMAWRDSRFVADLQKWTRFADAPDGLSCECLNLGGVERGGLRFALWLGRLPAPVAWAYARRDVLLTRASSAVAVLSSRGRDPLDLFEAGRRLLRAWVTINASGHSYHPISIVIDQATAPELTRLAGVEDAVAIFRVGYTDQKAATSSRRGLGDLLV